MKNFLYILILIIIFYGCSRGIGETPRPNILLAISDDQSYPHFSAYGCPFVSTPYFDKIAREGALFHNAYAPSPSCSPTRAALLTGRNIWQNGEAGVHISTFPKTLTVFPDLLEESGYHTGYTGKGWAPGNWKKTGWNRNPAGTAYNEHKISPGIKGVNQLDYTANFNEFLNKRKKGQPFFFWYGGFEPHRGYDTGSGLRSGKKLSSVDVPSFLVDDSVTRSDILDYALEIEYFDKHLGQMIERLEEMGEIDHTLIIVTSDNGMPFPRAKIQLYEYSVHMPLAICWGSKIKGERQINDLVSLIDIAPTILEAAKLDIPSNMTGESMMNILLSDKSGWIDDSRNAVVSGKERHEYSRADNMCYPIRAIRNKQYLYIRNLKPDRWPAGDPPYYRDSELNKPSGKSVLEKGGELLDLHVAKRPMEELFDLKNDPGCIKNLAFNPDYEKVKTQLWNRLKQILTEQKDPRMLGYGDVFDSYPVFKPMVLTNKQGEAFYPGFAKLGVYNNHFNDSINHNFKNP